MLHAQVVKGIGRLRRERNLRIVTDEVRFIVLKDPQQPWLGRWIRCASVHWGGLKSSREFHGGGSLHGVKAVLIVNFSQKRLRTVPEDDILHEKGRYILINRTRFLALQKVGENHGLGIGNRGFLRFREISTGNILNDVAQG